MGAKRLSIVQLSSWTEESSGTKKNLRNQYKRALRSLTESELVIQDGCVVSVSGTATGELKEWAGKRVPAGYRRTALAFALTASGRLESHRLLTIATKKEVNFLSQKIEAAL